MTESDVRGTPGEEKARNLPETSSVAGRGDAQNAPEPLKRKADDEWLALAAEDPAFFIKPSDTV